MNDTAERIIDIEWDMFENVNGDSKVSCQQNPDKFRVMRHVQFDQWSEEAKLSYLEDLQNAVREGRSLVREKYIYMMESTDPEGYEAFKNEAAEVTEEKKILVDRIWSIMRRQTLDMREKYPNVFKFGRPVLREDERMGYVSIETYQISELETYSEDTLIKLLRHIEALEEHGVEFAYKVQEASILSNGFTDLETAEKWAKEH